MAIELKMPALSPTMEKGTLAKWLVAEGDMVKVGDLVAEIETDKATMEMEANDAGRIAKLVVAEGTDNIAVGTTIALLSDANAPAAETVFEKPVFALSAQVAAASTAVLIAPEAASSSRQIVSELAPRHRGPSPADRVKVSPLAQRLAYAKGIDLAGIVGTGPNGRIVRADLGIAAPAGAGILVVQAPATAPSIAVIAPPPTGVPRETVKLSSMRKTIARRLSESKQTVPHFYLTVRCNLDPLLKLRGELNDALAARGIKLSVNDMLIKVLALTLLQVPEANVQFGGEVLHRFARADIAMAVAIDGGLITPVIVDAGNLPLSVIAQRSKLLAQKARDGQLLPEEYQGGTASISNLGMFGIDEMFPVINPPQALILGIGAGVEQPWKVNGEIALATVMSATASFDHRAIDGAVAAQFMAALRNLIENPLLIIG
jgi:pyruvate dehydrogenase E2 component (dihydrolipoamide acetyltransferase)